MELAKEYEKIVVACGGAVSNKSRKKLNLRIRQYTRKLNAQLSLFLIRRTGQDKFFNYTIVPLPPMNVMALACQTPIQWLESIENYAALTQRELAANHATAMENWLRKGRQGLELELRNSLARSSTRYFLRLAADFAAIPNLYNKYLE